MVAWHALIDQDLIPDRGVSAGTADDPFETDVPEAWVNFGCRASCAGKEAVSVAPDLVQSVDR